MTHLTEWRELIEDWRQASDTTNTRTLRNDIRNGDDATAARRVAFSAGFQACLESFDSFLTQRIHRERAGHSRPLPKGLRAPLRRLANRP